MSSRRVAVPLVVGVLGLAATAAGQPPEPGAPQRDVVFFAAGAAPLPAFGGQIAFGGGEAGALGAVVENKPYSARSITESTQTLADGNRITQRNEARVYRDSRGRTRREQTFAGPGARQAGGEPVTMITINDPVTGKGYVLDPVARTARELQPFQVALARAEGGAAQPGVAPGAEPQSGGGAAVENRVVTVVRRTFDGGAEQVVGTGVGAAVALAPLAAAPLGAGATAESLGEQVLEGLLVRGSRSTEIIAPGAMGNERAIEIVAERWYSPEIEALVRHRHVDPRFGETTYELVNVVRGEPSPDLFGVPAGYTVTVETGPPLLGVPPPAGGTVRTFTLRREAPAAE